jgi:hypothetical protein
MATIRVAYKRTFQCRSYESQTIELAIEDEAKWEGGLPLKNLYQQLEKIGDMLMAEALGRPDPAGRK